MQAFEREGNVWRPTKLPVDVQHCDKAMTLAYQGTEWQVTDIDGLDSEGGPSVDTWAEFLSTIGLDPNKDLMTTGYFDGLSEFQQDFADFGAAGAKFIWKDDHLWVHNVDVAARPDLAFSLPLDAELRYRRKLMQRLVAALPQPSSPPATPPNA
jgi:hypothetical protein